MSRVTSYLHSNWRRLMCCYRPFYHTFLICQSVIKGWERKLGPRLVVLPISSTHHRFIPCLAWLPSPCANEFFLCVSAHYNLHPYQLAEAYVSDVLCPVAMADITQPHPILGLRGWILCPTAVNPGGALQKVSSCYVLQDCRCQ